VELGKRVEAMSPKGRRVVSFDILLIRTVVCLEDSYDLYSFNIVQLTLTSKHVDVGGEIVVVVAFGRSSFNWTDYRGNIINANIFTVWAT